MRAWSKFLLGGAALLAVVPAAQAATIPVTTTQDVVANDGLCSLREAVFAARFDLAVQGCTAGTSGEDVIQLDAAEYRLAGGGASEDGNNSGDLDTGPSNIVRIIGRGLNATVIGGAGDRVFDVFSGASLGLADLSVRDGVAPEDQAGGAVRNKGSLTALRVAFTNNVAGDGHTPTSSDDNSSPGADGGAIASEGQLQISDSVFSGTRAGTGSAEREFTAGGLTTGFGARDGGNGGAIAVSAGTATITSSSFVGSRAGDGGTGMGGTSFAGGSGGSGGAIAVTGGSATVVNSTFQGNRAGNGQLPAVRGTDESRPGNGGGIAAISSTTSTGTASATFSTFSGNAAGTGPETAVGLGASVLGATVGGSILADAGGACATPTPGSLTNITLPGDTSCPGARIAGDPRLGALANNGGAVPTMAPAAGSPAIDALVGVPCPATDARGQLRPRFAGCDAGAFEVQPGTPGAPAAGAGGGARTLAPGSSTLRRISGVTLSRASFRTKGKRPLGTTLGVRLTVPSRIVLTVTKPATGRRSKGTCVAPTRKLSGKARCTRQVPLKGSLSKAGKAGLNTIAFSGKLRGRALAPGPYTFVLTLPKLGAAKPVVTTRGFRVLP